MVTVQLHHLIFNSFHGIHEEEKIIGNEYVVDVSIEFHELTEVIRHIDETVNYATIYKIIKLKMQIPTPLLETIAMEAGNQIYREFPEIKSITISIKKMHPPIEGLQGSAGVVWCRHY